MELTREMDGRKGVIFLVELSTLIPFIPITLPIALQKIHDQKIDCFIFKFMSQVIKVESFN